MNCYKLNGYPPDWKFKKKNGSGVELGGTGQMQGSQINDKPLATQVRYEKDSDVSGSRALGNARYEQDPNNNASGSGVWGTHPNFT